MPEADAPAGITVLPSTSTGVATVAVKVWPAVLIFDPTALASRTVSTVPAGTTTGLGASACGFDIAEPELFSAPAAGAALLSPGAVDSGAGPEELGSDVLLLQPSTTKDR
jgi:hypothetical protein